MKARAAVCALAGGSLRQQHIWLHRYEVEFPARKAGPI
jgi:hypothetical protein